VFFTIASVRERMIGRERRHAACEKVCTGTSTDDLKGLIVTKTLRIALLVASVPTVFFGAPAALMAQTGASAPGTDTPAQTSRDAITDQEVKLLQQDVRDQRRQIVAANLPLTTEESATFWPVYDEYIAEVTKILDSRYVQIKEYAGHYATMDDKQATDYLGKLFDADRALMDLRVKYLPRFEKVLTKKKSAMFLQMDRRLQMMIDLQRASLVPLINPK
jgi:Spy/CpxP family protein refolding chaperone